MLARVLACRLIEVFMVSFERDLLQGDGRLLLKSNVYMAVLLRLL